MSALHFVIFFLNLFLVCIYRRAIAERIENSNPSSDVEIVMGTRYKTPEKMIMPMVSGSPHLFFAYPEPSWRASAYLVSESGDESLRGVVLFHQYSQNHFIRVTVNITGLPPGKHAIHIHTFGDISRGCRTTGLHMPNNFVGNIEAAPDGMVSVSFYSSYLIMFGYRGIVGRSVVIHSNPIDQNHHLEVFSSTMMVIPIHEVGFQGEESMLGRPLMCGVVTITDNRAK